MARSPDLWPEFLRIENFDPETNTMIRQVNQKRQPKPPKPDQVIYDGASYSRSDLRMRGIGDETIIQMVASGEVTPCDNAGHGLRYFGDEINAWMKKNRQRVNKRSSDRKTSV